MDNECESDHKHYTCECGKEFEEYKSFLGHLPRCKVHNKKNPLNKEMHCKARKPGGWTCVVCGKTFATRRDRQAHSKQVHKELYGKKCWNQGLTKETSESIRRNAKAVSKSMKSLFASGKLDAHKAWTPERRKAQSERKKKLYKEHPELHPNRLLAGNRNKMTYPERIAFDWLTSHNIKFEHQYNFVTEKFNRFVDFYCKDYNLFIEIDGEHWHIDKNRDYQKDIDAKEHGYNTLRIQAKERIETTLDEFFSYNCDI